MRQVHTISALLILLTLSTFGNLLWEKEGYIPFKAGKELLFQKEDTVVRFDNSGKEIYRYIQDGTIEKKGHILDDGSMILLEWEEITDKPSILHTANFLTIPHNNIVSEKNNYTDLITNLYDNRGNSLLIKSGDMLEVNNSGTIFTVKIVDYYSKGFLTNPSKYTPEVKTLSDLLKALDQVTGGNSFITNSGELNIDMDTTIRVENNGLTIKNVTRPTSDAFVKNLFNIPANHYGNGRLILVPASKNDLISNVYDAGGKALGFEEGDEITVKGVIGNDSIKNVLPLKYSDKLAINDLFEYLKTNLNLPNRVESKNGDSIPSISINMDTTINAPIGSIIIRSDNYLKSILSNISINATNHHNNSTAPSAFISNMVLTDITYRLEEVNIANTDSVLNQLNNYKYILHGYKISENRDTLNKVIIDTLVKIGYSNYNIEYKINNIKDGIIITTSNNGESTYSALKYDYYLNRVLKHSSYGKSYHKTGNQYLTSYYDNFTKQLKYTYYTKLGEILREESINKADILSKLPDSIDVINFNYIFSEIKILGDGYAVFMRIETNSTNYLASIFLDKEMDIEKVTTYNTGSKYFFSTYIENDNIYIYTYSDEKDSYELITLNNSGEEIAIKILSKLTVPAFKQWDVNKPIPSYAEYSYPQTLDIIKDYTLIGDTIFNKKGELFYTLPSDDILWRNLYLLNDSTLIVKGHNINHRELSFNLTDTSETGIISFNKLNNKYVLPVVYAISLTGESETRIIETVQQIKSLSISQIDNILELRNLNSDNVTTIQMFNIRGQLLENISFSAKDYSLRTNQLSAGIYVMRINNGLTNITKKISIR